MVKLENLLSQLEDPFEMFPLQGVGQVLAEAIVDSEDLARQSLTYGLPLKYQTDEDVYYYDRISLLIGAAFVLGQTSITRAVAMTKRVGDLAGRPNWLPNRKDDILGTAATIHPETGLSEIILFDSVANYFKHHHEWPSDWSPGSASGPQRHTIEVVRRLGLSPHAHDNLTLVLYKLGLRATGVNSLGDKIQDWRERLAQHLRRELDAHGLSWNPHS